jgi:hypothetical protein
MAQDKSGKEPMGAVVAAAVEAFEGRFGVAATDVAVHESVVDDLSEAAGGRVVRRVKYVRPHCALAGVESFEPESH